MVFVGAFGFTACLAIIVYTLATRVKTSKNTSLRVKTTSLLVWTCAIIIWPIVWALVLQKHVEYPNVWVSLLWPIMVLGFDMYMTFKRPYDMDMTSRRNVLSMDANALCSITFAMAGVLSAHGPNSGVSHVFIYAILGCFAFVMPSPHSAVHPLDTMFVESLQKVVLTYSTGLLLAGVMLLTATSSAPSLTGGKGSSDKLAQVLKGKIQGEVASL